MTLLTTERTPTGQQFLAVDLFPTFLNTGTTDETFQQSRKQDSFRHILNSSASMYESSGSQFSRTTAGIQTGPDAFKVRYDLFNHLGSGGNMQFQISSRKENR